MKTVIVIPWREHPSRLEAFNRLIEIFTNTFPDFEIIVSDSTEEKFNLAQARNLGAKEAIARGADIIVFNDADLCSLQLSFPEILESLPCHTQHTANITLLKKH
jgi:hypothetical protein